MGRLPAGSSRLSPYHPMIRSGSVAAQACHQLLARNALPPWASRGHLPQSRDLQPIRHRYAPHDQGPRLSKPRPCARQACACNGQRRKAGGMRSNAADTPPLPPRRLCPGHVPGVPRKSSRRPGQVSGESHLPVQLSYTMESSDGAMSRRCLSSAAMPQTSGRKKRPTKRDPLTTATPQSPAMPPTGSEKVRLQSKDTASLVGFRPAPSRPCRESDKTRAQRKPEAPATWSA